MVTDTAFRRKAEQLADLEAQMLELSASQMKHVDVDWRVLGAKEKSKRQMMICLAIAAVCGIGLKLSPGGTLSLIFGFGLLCALAGLYMAHARTDEAKSTERSWQAVQSKIDAMQQQRSGLIAALNQMRREDPALEGKYWWDAGAEPAVRIHSEMPGKSLPDSIWKLNLLQTISVTPRQDGLYCEDLHHFPTALPAEDLQAMLQSQTMAVLYENEQIMAQEHEWFQLLQLYAVDMECIEEIEGKTTTVRVDKEAEMEAYREKLDRREIMRNYINRNRLTTNRDEADMGYKTQSERLHDEIMRDMVERDYRGRLDKEPDEYEQTHYRKVFRGLCDTAFIPCAYVLISLRPESDGQTAMILVPRMEVDSIRIVMRTGSSFCGYLERYRGREALKIGEYQVQPSIHMAADCLFTQEAAAQLKLKPRDILAPKPQGLTDKEWSYLIWRDRHR